MAIFCIEVPLLFNPFKLKRSASAHSAEKGVLRFSRAKLAERRKETDLAGEKQCDQVKQNCNRIKLIALSYDD